MNVITSKPIIVDNYSNMDADKRAQVEKFIKYGSSIPNFESYPMAEKAKVLDSFGLTQKDLSDYFSSTPLDLDFTTGEGSIKQSEPSQVLPTQPKTGKYRLLKDLSYSGEIKAKKGDVIDLVDIRYASGNLSGRYVWGSKPNEANRVILEHKNPNLIMAVKVEDSIFNRSYFTAIALIVGFAVLGYLIIKKK